MMYKFTKNGYQIKLDAKLGYISFEGRLNTEDLASEAEGILDSINQHCDSLNDITTLELRLEHFNTSACKILIQLIARIKESSRSDKAIIFNWYHIEDDEDMIEFADDFNELTGLKPNLIPVAEIARV